MVVRPFVFYRQNVIERLKDYLQDQISGWCLNWFSQEVLPKIELFQGDGLAEHVDTFRSYIDKKLSFTCASGAILVWESPQLVLKELAREEAFPPDEKSELCSYLLERLAQDFFSGITEDGRCVERLIEPNLIHSQGSGWLTGYFTIAEVECYFCIPPADVDSLAEKLHLSLLQKVSARLEPVANGCQKLATELSVELLPLELTLEELLQIQVGDIIRLDHPLEEPAVILNDGDPVLTGALGVSGDRKAIKLVSKQG
ncbi:FliM/FliN family flagellar motor switch protein [Hahella ganghwensis]|uniref:FliM/FliN family flagellar motor switch protein n=1 Tax=Hahella ganghwensis TaxID=286420 RepID=UPI000372626D|nr:FliM/FliN family flagellar motor C-terminal domain-containing protein [Hahella ganghwensis]